MLVFAIRKVDGVAQLIANHPNATPLLCTVRWSADIKALFALITLVAHIGLNFIIVLIDLLALIALIILFDLIDPDHFDCPEGLKSPDCNNFPDSYNFQACYIFINILCSWLSWLL